MKKILSLITLLLFTTSLFAADNKELQEAYQKEYAFLTAQKEALEKRIAEHKKESKTRISKAQKEINKLQDRYIAKSTQGEKFATLLVEAEEESINIQDNSVILEATFSQADSTLRKYDYKFKNEKAEPATKIDTLFKDAVKIVNSLQSVRVEKGEFFLPDGKKTEATLYKVGNIATYGKSEQASGALAPAGGGHMKLWKDPASDSADALFAGKSPEFLNIFIYENATVEVEDKKEKTVGDVLESGGVIGYLIVLLGLVALGLIFARGFFLKGAGARTENVTVKVSQTLADGKIDDAIEKAKKQPGAAARVITATLRNIDRDREHIEDIISESILHESSTLDRFGTAIIVIAAVAPLMGLLGTVTGMISTFEIITEFGTGDPKLLSGGISEALVTTELGLIVAIPAIIFGNLLSGWADRIKNDMEQSALTVINVYQKAKRA